MPGIAPGAVTRGDHRLLASALAALAFIQLGFYWHGAWLWLGMGCAVLGARFRAGWRFPATLLLLALLHAGWQLRQQQQQRWPEPGPFVGTFTVLAAQAAPDRTRVLLQDELGRRFRVAAYGARATGLSALQPPACVQARLRLKPPHGTVNWTGFDYGRWLYSQGIDAIGSLQYWQPCAGTQPEPTIAPAAMAPGMALQRALVYADRSGFDQQIWETLARTGLSHLFAISGLHLGLLGAWGWGVGAFLWRVSPRCQAAMPRRRLAGISSALWMSAYMLLAHAQVSAWRAWSMGMLALGLMSLGRAASPRAAWSLALLAVLLVSPRQSLHASLWLSFAAVLLLLAAWPWLKPWRWPCKLIAMQVLLGVGMAPLCWAWFGQWSLVGLGLNLVLVPTMTVLLPLCLGAALVRALSGWVAPQQWLAELLDALYAGLSVVAKPSWAVWPASSLSLIEASVLLAALVALLLLGPQRRPQVGAGLLLWCLGVWLAMRPLPPPLMDAAEVWIMDVGQGAAALVRTAEHVVVIDSGPRSPSGRFDAGAMIVRPQLRALGVDQIDLLITTHEDNDHAGGRRALKQAFGVAQEWGDFGQDCRESQQWMADGVRLSSLQFARSQAWSKNDLSCVVLLEVGAVRMLFPGDIEAAAETAMLAHPRLQQGVDVVLVPHHGSATSSTADWVALLGAAWAIVPAGSHNRWGFPRAHVVQRWQSSGSTVLSTSAGGAIRIELPNLRITRPAPRPWRLEAL